jgi:hypothetical protein
MHVAMLASSRVQTESPISLTRGFRSQFHDRTWDDFPTQRRGSAVPGKLTGPALDQVNASTTLDPS